MTHSAADPQALAPQQPFPGRPLDSREAARLSWQTEMLRLFWDHRRALLRATTVGLLGSTLAAFLIPARYTSTTQLMPPDSQASGMAMISALAKAGGGVGSMTGDLLGLKSTGDLFVGMLHSETCQMKLVEEFDLRKVYGVKLIQDARARLDEHTSIAPDRKSGIITISVTDRSPQRAAALANAYVDQLNRLVTQLSTSAAHRERVFLEDRLKLAKQDLDAASSDLAEFASNNNTLDIQQTSKAMLDAAGNIAGQLIAAQSELEGLRQIYTDDNARVQSLSARVGELRRQLARFDGAQGEAADWRGSAAPAALLLPARSREMPYPSMRTLPLLGVKYADYYRQSKMQETVYELLTEQYELAKIQEAKETPSVKVLDGARVPEKKSFPPRLLVIAFGTFLAFAASVVCSAALASWRATDRCDPRKVLLQEAATAIQARLLWFSPKRRQTNE